LNPDNFREWQSMRRLSDRYAFLERLLTSHLLAFAQGVGWQIPDRFEARITDMIKEEWITFKGIKVLAFNLEFECPLQLPDYIGLGKGSSIGWGVVRRLEDNRHKMRPG
ncbi:MAG TPA: CRISPR-associated endonuclease Cas6, partial [Flavilitoribacter sp.]|nr:CRISPR-associated endonuclease Cas6 [Flavilitoribacter sp.]